MDVIIIDCNYLLQIFYVQTRELREFIQVSQVQVQSQSQAQAQSQSQSQAQMQVEIRP
jgi:hypothetical protein